MGCLVGRLLILIAGGLLILALVVANLPDGGLSFSTGGIVEWFELFTLQSAQPKSDPETHWVEILLLITIPSMFGGLLAVLQIVANLTGLGFDDRLGGKDAGQGGGEGDGKDADKGDGGTGVDKIYSSYQKLKQEKPLNLWYLIGILVGLGGGLTVLIVLALDGKFDQPPKDKDRLLFIGTGLISGYLGIRLVRRLSSQFLENLKGKTDALSKQAVALNQKADAIAKELTAKSEEFDAKAQAVSQRTEQISEAVASNIVKTAGDIGFVVANTLADPNLQMPTSGITDAIQRLNEALKIDSTNRRNTLFLARILRHQRKDVEGLLMGIKTLDHGISERSQRYPEVELMAAEVANENAVNHADDTAAIYYNRSCYRAVVYGIRKLESDRDASLDDFEVTLNLYPPNVLEVDDDSDFDSIRNEQRYIDARRVARERLGLSAEDDTTRSAEATESEEAASTATVSSADKLPPGYDPFVDGPIADTATDDEEDEDGGKSMESSEPS